MRSFWSALFIILVIWSLDLTRLLGIATVTDTNGSAIEMSAISAKKIARILEKPIPNISSPLLLEEDIIGTE